VEDRQRLTDGSTRLWVGAGDVTEKGAIGRGRRIQQHWHMAGDQPVRGLRHQRRQSGLGDRGVQDLDPIFLEQRRDVHRWLLIERP
jgi:hypothetical protein